MLENEFIRHSLSLPVNHIINDQDKKKFNKQLNDIKNKYNLDNHSILDLNKVILSLKINLNNKTYTFLDFDFLNKCLKFLEIDKVLLQYYFDEKLSLIYAKNTIFSQLSNAYLLKDEEVRSSNLPPSLAALNIDEHIYLRSEAINLIYEFKWKVVDDNMLTINALFLTDEENIGLNFKKQYLKLFSNKNEEQIKKQIIENVFFHEKGHEVSNSILHTNFVGFCLASKSVNASLFHDIYEVLADICSSENNAKGTLKNILKIAKKDSPKATQLFYLYLSDTWFFDTEDEYMFDYSLFIHIIMQSAINTDLSINFEKLQIDLNFEDPNSFYTQLVTSLNSQFEEINKFFQSIKYIDKLKKVSFFTLQTDVEDYINEQVGFLDKSSYDYKAKCWNVFFNKLKLIVFDRKTLSKHIKKAESKILNVYAQHFFSESLSKEQLLKRVISKYKELGLYHE